MMTAWMRARRRSARVELEELLLGVGEVARADAHEPSALEDGVQRVEVEVGRRHRQGRRAPRARVAQRDDHVLIQAARVRRLEHARPADL